MNMLVSSSTTYRKVLIVQIEDATVFTAMLDNGDVLATGPIDYCKQIIDDGYSGIYH
jgi:hypothetical protein